MGKLKNVLFNIQGQPPFKAGDLVTGTVAYLLECDTKVKSIKLTFDGYSKVKWTKSTDDDEKVYKSLEVYLSKDVYLHGESGGHEVTVPGGQHRSPFNVRLPGNIPSSFSSKHGNIIYSVKLTAEHSGMFREDEVISHAFRVINPIDLAVDRPASQMFARQTRIQEEMMDTGCCTFSNDMVKFDITTDKSAYNPGESIVINGYLMNGCSKSTQTVSMILYQNVTVFGKRSNFSLTSSGHTKSKAKRVEIAKWMGEKVRARGTASYANRRTISIPDVGESDLKHCQNIDVKYTIRFKVLLGGFLGVYVTSDDHPIFIGNGRPAPSSSEIRLTPSAPEDAVLLSPSTVGISHDIDAHAQGDKPPSYESALSMDVPQATYNKPETTSTTQGSYYDWSASAFTYS